MGLEQQISSLVQASENLTSAVNNKIGEIDRSVNDAVSAVPNTVNQLFNQTLYVNGNTGKSSNSGVSDDQPLKYLNDAIQKVPSGGRARIIVRNNIAVFHDEWPLNGRSKQEININSGKSIYIDLSGNYIIINTSHYNPWGNNNLNIDSPCLDKSFIVGINSFLELSNGAIKINAQSGDESKALYSHTSMSCIFNNDSSRTQLASMVIESTIPTVGLFGLDNWGSMGFNAHLRDTSLNGVGILKRIINGADKNDITIKKMNVQSTWTE
ncbi:hypothetical protein ACSWVZ_002592 [Photobacterium damselae]